MKTMTENPIRDLVQDILSDMAEKHGVELDDEARDLEDKADFFMEEIEEYIKGLVEQESYSEDPYVYNGVSRSDFL